MAKFEIVGPDGHSYEVEGDNEAGALAALRKSLGQSVATGPGVVERFMAGENIGQGEVAPRAPSGVEDVARAIASGAVRGAEAVADLPGNFARGATGLAARGLEAIGAIEPETGRIMREAADFVVRRSPAGMREPTRETAREMGAYRGEGRPARYAGTATEFATSGLLGGGLLGAPLTSSGVVYGLIPGLASEAAGQATEGMQIPDWVPLVGGQPAEPWARTGAALMAPAAVNAAMRVVTPNPARPARIEAAKRLEGEDVRVTAGQRTGDATLRTREEYIPRTAQMMEDQAEDFTRAVLRRINVDAPRATGEVMNNALKRIGGMFDDLASRNTIRSDRNLKVAADAAIAAFDDLSTTPAKAPLLTNIIDKIDDAMRSGTAITGDQYQAWRSRLGRTVAKTNDAALREGASVLLDALDGAMERTLRAAGNVDDLATYALARQQYRDYLAIERAVSGAGGTSGIVTPGALRSAVVGQGRRSYVTGGRDLGELSKAANEVFPASHGHSGTAERIAANTIPGAMTATPAGLLGYALSGDPYIATLAGAAGAMAPTARNAIAGSSAGQAWLGNQLLPMQYGIMDPRTSAIAAALLAEEEKRAEQ